MHVLKNIKLTSNQTQLLPWYKGGFQKVGMTGCKYKMIVCLNLNVSCPYYKSSRYNLYDEV